MADMALSVPGPTRARRGDRRTGAPGRSQHPLAGSKGLS